MKRHILIEQFRKFYFKNYPDDMQQLIEYFSIFGGLEAEIDISRPLEINIKDIILNKIDILQTKIDKITYKEKHTKRLLRALAIGDRRIFSAFKRAHLNNGNGGGALNKLEQNGIVTIEYSREEPA